MAVHERPALTLGAVDARHTQIKRRYFLTSPNLGLPMLYVQESSEIGSYVLSDAINGSDPSIFEPCSR